MDDESRHRLVGTLISPPAAAEPEPQSRRSSALWSWVRRVGLLLFGVAALEYVAVHLLAGVQQSWPSVGAAEPVLLGLALAAELASLACFSGLTFVLLPEEARPSYLTVLAIDVTGYGVSHVVPGGGATAAALRFRLLGRVNVSAVEAVGVATLELAVGVLWTLAVFVLGLVVAVPNPQTHPFLKTASVLAVVLVATFGGLVAVLMARPDQLVTVTHALARGLPLVPPQSLERIVRALIDQIQLVLSSNVQRRRAALWGLGNWSLDVASLYLALWAFGDSPNPGGLLITYALVCLLALLPVTPGGSASSRALQCPRWCPSARPMRVRCWAC